MKENYEREHNSNQFCDAADHLILEIEFGVENVPLFSLVMFLEVTAQHSVKTRNNHNKKENEAQN